jgi:hypothetical protein
MAAKFFTGLPLDGPDPECVKGFGATALSDVDRVTAPRPATDHSRPSRKSQPVPVTIGWGPAQPGVPGRACDENPLAGFVPLDRQR